MFETITMQCPSCCHVMALCHEDKQISYFQCKHGTCFASGMKCKCCNVTKVSKKDKPKISNRLCKKHYKQENLSSSHFTSTTSNSIQTWLNKVLQYHQIQDQLKQQQWYHCQLFLIYPQSHMSINNLIILIVNQISLIFSQHVPSFSWGCAWHSMACYTCRGNFATNFSTLEAIKDFYKTYNQFQQSSSKHCIDLMKLLHMTV